MCWTIILLLYDCVNREKHGHLSQTHDIELCPRGKIHGPCNVTGPALRRKKCEECNYEYIIGDGFRIKIRKGLKYVHMSDDGLYTKVSKGQAWFGAAREFK
jgi:hypothetical protein